MNQYIHKSDTSENFFKADLTQPLSIYGGKAGTGVGGKTVTATDKKQKYQAQNARHPRKTTNKKTHNFYKISFHSFSKSKKQARLTRKMSVELLMSPETRLVADEVNTTNLPLELKEDW